MMVTGSRAFSLVASLGRPKAMKVSSDGASQMLAAAGATIAAANPDTSTKAAATCRPVILAAPSLRDSAYRGNRSGALLRLLVPIRQPRHGNHKQNSDGAH